MKACVIGGGSWGSAFALHLGRMGIPTQIWIREEEIRRELAETGTNRLFLPGFLFPLRFHSSEISGPPSRVAKPFSWPCLPNFSGASFSGWRPIWMRFEGSSA